MPVCCCPSRPTHGCDRAGHVVVVQSHDVGTTPPPHLHAIPPLHHALMDSKFARHAPPMQPCSVSHAAPLLRPGPQGRWVAARRNFSEMRWHFAQHPHPVGDWVQDSNDLLGNPWCYVKLNGTNPQTLLIGTNHPSPVWCPRMFLLPTECTWMFTATTNKLP
jgi:hypothetical protein